MEEGTGYGVRLRASLMGCEGRSDGEWPSQAYEVAYKGMRVFIFANGPLRASNKPDWYLGPASVLTGYVAAPVMIYQQPSLALFEGGD